MPPLRHVALALPLVLACACSDASMDAGTSEPRDASSSPSTDANLDADAAAPTTSDAGQDAPGEAGPPATAWAELAAGITARSTGLGSATAPRVGIVYGGFGAAVSHTQAWADALFSAALAAESIGWLVAVKGPDDPRYLTRNDIANSQLAAELTGRRSGKTYGSVVVIAHSSGAYVAEELFSQLAPTNGALGKVRYYDLDGDARDLAPVRASLERVRFVYAKDGALLSRNAGAMQTAAAAAGVLPFVVDASASGCLTANCLHDAVILRKPHDPSTFDLARDYTMFSADRPVVTSYLAN